MLELIVMTERLKLVIFLKKELFWFMQGLMIDIEYERNARKG
jgi:hypothetical protein